jgi:hypothetical protein
VLEIVETHPTIAAIRNGEAVTDLQLVALECTVRQTESLAAEKLKHQLSVEKKNGDREIKKRFDS